MITATSSSSRVEYELTSILGGTIKDGHRSPLEGTVVEFLIYSVLGAHVR